MRTKRVLRRGMFADGGGIDSQLLYKVRVFLPSLQGRYGLLDNTDRLKLKQRSCSSKGSVLHCSYTILC